MRKNKLIVLLFSLIIILTGCSRQEVFINESNEIKKATIEEIEKESNKCFVIIGKEDDKYTNSLSRHLENAVKIENEKIYLLYLDEIQEKNNSIFSPKKIPTLYVVENNKIVDSIEYYNDKDVVGMDSPNEVEFATKIREKISEFVNKNKS
ncbi:MAG: hypothetical protein ACLUVC_01595 [Longibaculum sp.]